MSQSLRNFGQNHPEALEKALDSASEVYISAVKAKAPKSKTSKRGENYKSSIKVLEKGRLYRIIGSDRWVFALSTGKSYNLGLILEIGSKAHDIEPVLASVLFWTEEHRGKTGGKFSMKVKHPGTPPQPHFVPAISILKNKFPNLYLQFTKVLWRS